jgi:hypothetical protein
MTQDTDASVTYRPPIRRVIRGLLSDYGRPFGVADDLLVSMVHVETDTPPAAIRATLTRLEADGEIYDVRGNWKVTRA